MSTSWQLQALQIPGWTSTWWVRPDFSRVHAWQFPENLAPSPFFIHAVSNAVFGSLLSLVASWHVSVIVSISLEGMSSHSTLTFTLVKSPGGEPRSPRDMAVRPKAKPHQHQYPGPPEAKAPCQTILVVDFQLFKVWNRQFAAPSCQQPHLQKSTWPEWICCILLPQVIPVCHKDHGRTTPIYIICDELDYTIEL